MDDNQQQSGTSGPIFQESTQGKNAKWLWLLIVLIIIGALVFAFVRGIGPFGQFKLGGGEEQVVEEETSSLETFIASSSPESSPQATESAKLDKSEPAIRVLNGSGKVGVAGAMKSLLEETGWVVKSVGNSDSYDFTSTVLRFKETYKKYEASLKEDLSDDYSISVDGKTLEATDSADIEVIVGSK